MDKEKTGKNTHYVFTGTRSRAQTVNSTTSIKWKIFAYLIAFCLLLLVILWLFQTVFLDSFYRTIKMRQVEQEAARIAEYLAKDDWDALQNAVLERGDLYMELWSEAEGSQTIPGNLPEGLPHILPEEDKQALLEATRANGGTKTQVDSFSPGPANLLGRDKAFTQDTGASRAEESKTGGATPGGERQGERQKILYTRLVGSGDGEKLLIVSADISPVSATVETLRVQILYVSAIMLVLAILLALLIARRVSAPIETLTKEAGQLAKGVYDVRFSASGGYREITQLAATLDHAAEELAKTDALRKELIANVSHDLRTPLTLITGYAEMIRDIPGENSPENMQVIIDEAKRLTLLVSDLLDLSRLQSGTQELHSSRFNLTEEAQEAIRRFAKFSEPEGITVPFTFAQDLYVEADSTRILQVIYNFLINAMNHGGPDKTIHVEQTLQDERVTMRVTDSGEGIAPEDLPLIWERYYKVDKIHKRLPSGNGLGLSIVKSILEQHPGMEYGVESTLGQGSSFWFSLPVAE